MKIVLDKNEYELIKNYKEAFILEDLEKRYEEYFDRYDYIMGDYAYGKLRLKGFLKSDHKEVNDANDYSKLDKYLKDFCAFDCKYYVIVKK